MADIFTKEKRSAVMALIKSKNTSPERLVFAYLRKRKIHFRKHYGLVRGSPDVALPSKKRAVFIDGDFWHGRHYAARKDAMAAYWQQKIEGNVKRDKRQRAALRKMGWKLLKVWTSDLQRVRTREKSCAKIAKFLQNP